MPQFMTAGELAGNIRKLGEKDIEDLAPDVDGQNVFIFNFMNVAMWKLARLANNVEYSDPLLLEEDGFVTFQKGAQAIQDMFEPKTIYMPDGQAMVKRTSDEYPFGWWRESQNLDIHIRGFAIDRLTPGEYTLKYIRYPRKVENANDPVDFPPTGYDALIKEILSLIKYPKNSYQGADFMETKAKSSYGNLAQGAISASGTGTTGQPIGEKDVQTARGG